MTKTEIEKIQTIPELASYLTELVESKFDEIDSRLYSIEDQLDRADEEDGYARQPPLSDWQKYEAICPVCKTTVPAGTHCCPNCGMICGDETRRH